MEDDWLPLGAGSAFDVFGIGGVHYDEEKEE